jgi:acyl carrier protein
MAVAEDIRGFIAEELLEGEQIEGDPIADGRLDSLALEQVIGFIEDHYGIVFEDDDLVLENFASLTALTALVEAKLPPSDQ